MQGANDARRIAAAASITSAQFDHRRHAAPPITTHDLTKQKDATELTPRITEYK